MKLTRRGRFVFGSLFIAIFVMISGMVGIPPATSPTKAEAMIAVREAQAEVLLEYQNSDKLTDMQLVELLSATGFTGQDLREAWAIAKKESNGRPLAHNGNRKTGDNSYGMFQINMLGSIGEERRIKFGLKYKASKSKP